jgi:hypothetical protein
LVVAGASVGSRCSIWSMADPNDGPAASSSATDAPVQRQMALGSHACPSALLGEPCVYRSAVWLTMGRRPLGVLWLEVDWAGCPR